SLPGRRVDVPRSARTMRSVSGDPTGDPIPRTIAWRVGTVRLIDQRRLPEELVFIDATTVDELCDAIATLAIRGAPALGAAGAMGVALASMAGQPLEEAAERIRRPPVPRLPDRRLGAQGAPLLG